MSTVTQFVCEICRKRADKLEDGWFEISATNSANLEFRGFSNNRLGHWDKTEYGDVHFCSVACFSKYITEE